MLALINEVFTSMEECSACKRIAQCVCLPGIDGYFCETCLDELASASNGCAFSLVSGDAAEGEEAYWRQPRFVFFGRNRGCPSPKSCS
jgi:hypothetical protein